MPYKDPEKKRVVSRNSYEQKRLATFEKQGLIPVDHSLVQCVFCEKVSSKMGAHMYRHHSWCRKAEEFPIRTWSRRKGASSAEKPPVRSPKPRSQPPPPKPEITVPLTFEGRQYLRKLISQKQIIRERRDRLLQEEDDAAA